MPGSGVPARRSRSGEGGGETREAGETEDSRTKVPSVDKKVGKELEDDRQKKLTVGVGSGGFPDHFHGSVTEVDSALDPVTVMKHAQCRFARFARTLFLTSDAKRASSTRPGPSHPEQCKEQSTAPDQSNCPRGSRSGSQPQSS